MSTTPEQTPPQGSKPNWFLTITGIVAIATTLVDVTTPAIRHLLGSVWGGIVVFTVIFIFFCNLPSIKVWKTRKTRTGLRYHWNKKKKNAWRFGLVCFFYCLALSYVVLGNQLITKYFPKKEIAVFINQIEGDNNALKITDGIRSNAGSHLAEYENVQLIGTNDTFHFDSDDYKKIGDQFLSRWYTRGLFAYGWYRAEDSSLAGHIYMKQLNYKDSLHRKIIFPGLDSIKVSVSRKSGLFGNFIAALIYHGSGDFLASNDLLEEILKDSNVLDYRFKYHCHNYRSLNYARQNDEEKAKLALDQARQASAGQECHIERQGGMFTLKAGDGFQFSTPDSMYQYKNYVVILHKMPKPEYSLLKCGTRWFSRYTFRSEADIALTIDRLEKIDLSVTQ